jgi:dUTP pyrophosphatase
MFLSDVSKLSRGSHAIVKVQCQSKISEQCYGIVERTYKDVMNTLERNDGKYICLPCSRRTKNMGENNPKYKYDYDRSFFHDIDTHEKAYLLGWIASDGSVPKSGWRVMIKIHERDIKCLDILKNIICKDITIKHSDNTVGFSINSQEICMDICRHLQINPGKKSHVVRFPDLNDELRWVFLRGYFDGDGTVRKYGGYKTTPDCGIASESTDMLTEIGEFSKIPHRITDGQINYYGTNSIDFLGKLYANCGIYKLDRKYETYIKWLSWRPMIRGKASYSIIPNCYVFKTDQNAFIPSKAKESDVGYDLTIIKQEKILTPASSTGGGVILYDTGIKIHVDYGYYAEIVPRSSLSKSGYMLANSIGIIDNSYCGNIFVALIKINLDAQEIVLPFKCCQIIFRQQNNVQITEICEKFDETTRGEGGFGSSDT